MLMPYAAEVASSARTYHQGDTIPNTAVGTLIQLQSRIHVYGDTRD